MGSPAALKAVRYAIAMGLRQGGLLSDRKFGGADTLCDGAHTFARAARGGAVRPAFAGERATDGETGRSAGLRRADGRHGALLRQRYRRADRRAHPRHARRRGRSRDGRAAARDCDSRQGDEHSAPLHARRQLRAKAAAIPSQTADDLHMDGSETGLSGSATQVVRVTYPKVTRQGRRINSAEGLESAIGE